MPQISASIRAKNNVQILLFSHIKDSLTSIQINFIIAH